MKLRERRRKIGRRSTEAPSHRQKARTWQTNYIYIILVTLLSLTLGDQACIYKTPSPTADLAEVSLYCGDSGMDEPFMGCKITDFDHNVKGENDDTQDRPRHTNAEWKCQIRVKGPCDDINLGLRKRSRQHFEARIYRWVLWAWVGTDGISLLDLLEEAFRLSRFRAIHQEAQIQHTYIELIARK